MARKSKNSKNSRYQPSVHTLAALVMAAIPQYDKYETLAEKSKRLAWWRSSERVRSSEELRRMDAAEQKRANRLVRNQLWLRNYQHGNAYAAYRLGLR